MRIFTKNIHVAVCLGGALSAACLGAGLMRFYTPEAPQIFTLDMKKVMRAEVARLSSKNLSEQELRAQIDGLPMRLDLILKKRFPKQKPMILKPGAVVTSLPDLTPEVLKALDDTGER